MDFEKIATECVEEISAGPIPEPSAENVERVGRFLARNGWNPNVAGEADFTAACRALAKCFCAPRKGLLIHGSFGCGKTAFLKAIKPLFKPVHFVPLNDPDIAAFLDKPEWLEDALTCNMILDDLGAESAANEYGIMRELAGEFVVRYHNKGERRLFISTNLSGEEMVERYSSRVCSRLKDLCLPLHLTGGDKRKWSGAKASVERASGKAKH